MAWITDGMIVGKRVEGGGLDNDMAGYAGEFAWDGAGG